MKPKISDFSLARIFGGSKQGQTPTKWLEHMAISLEYALDGFFSDKSDVFSFGVVLLEIVSGKKNTGFYQAKHALSLIGYALRLWKEDKALDLRDLAIIGACNISEFLRGIIVRLLCVQEDLDDHPTMSNVVFMLGSETASLPTPNNQLLF